MWAVGLILLGWLGCFLKEGYRIWVFAVAHFQIFPGLKQVHKKGKCHNGYSTSVLNGHHCDKPVLENYVKIPMSSSHPVSIVTFQVVTIQFPCEIPCHNSEKRQVFGSFSLLNTFGLLTGIFPFACNGNYMSWIWVWGVQVMTCTWYMWPSWSWVILRCNCFITVAYWIIFTLLIFKTLLQKWSWYVYMGFLWIIEGWMGSLNILRNICGFLGRMYIVSCTKKLPDFSEDYVVLK